MKKKPASNWDVCNGWEDIFVLIIFMIAFAFFIIRDIFHDLFNMFATSSPSDFVTLLTFDLIAHFSHAIYIQISYFQLSDCNTSLDSLRGHCQKKRESLNRSISELEPKDAFNIYFHNAKIN